MNTRPGNAIYPGFLYRLLSLPLLIAWIFHAIINGSRHGLSSYLAMRSGSGKSSGDDAMIWVHASSVGEVQAVTPLVRAYIDRGEKILFTSFTATGYRAIQEIFSDSVHSGVIPFDFIYNCGRFFNQHAIRLALIMETELWPELLYQARRRGIPLLQINARLSAKSSDAPAFVRRLLKATLGYFSKILTRSEKDRDALLALGADPEIIAICGNLKSYNADSEFPLRLIERDYLILASSHEGEEQQFLQLCPADYIGPLLVIAPRHPDRSGSIQNRIDQIGLSYAVRSEQQAIDNDTQVYLADTLGELKSLMAHARIVVMGGSFDNTGGHNLNEAAALGRAMITGPSDDNITEDISMLGNGKGVLQVADMQQCWQTIQDLLDHPDRAEALGKEAKSRLASQPDIISIYMQAIEPWS